LTNDNARSPRSSLRLVLPVAFVAMIIWVSALHAIFSADKPSAPVNDLTEAKETWAASNAEEAETLIKGILKDPNSANFRHVGVIMPKQFDRTHTGVDCGEVNARNSFGAYTGFTAFMVLSGIPMIQDGSRAFGRLYNKECANKVAFYPAIL